MKAALGSTIHREGCLTLLQLMVPFGFTNDMHILNIFNGEFAGQTVEYNGHTFHHHSFNLRQVQNEYKLLGRIDLSLGLPMTAPATEGRLIYFDRGTETGTEYKINIKHDEACKEIMYITFPDIEQHQNMLALLGVGAD